MIWVNMEPSSKELSSNPVCDSLDTLICLLVSPTKSCNSLRTVVVPKIPGCVANLIVGQA